MTGVETIVWVMVALLALGFIIAASIGTVISILEKRERARQTAMEMERGRAISRQRILERQEAKPVRVAKAQQKLWKKYGHQVLLDLTNNNAPLADSLSHSDDIMKSPTIYNKMKHLAKLDNKATAETVALFKELPHNPSETGPSQEIQPSNRKSVLAKIEQREVERKRQEAMERKGQEEDAAALRRFNTLKDFHKNDPRCTDPSQITPEIPRQPHSPLPHKLKSTEMTPVLN